MFGGSQNFYIRRHHIALLHSDIIYRALTLVILTFWPVLDTRSMRASFRKPMRSIVNRNKKVALIQVDACIRLKTLQ